MDRSQMLKLMHKLNRYYITLNKYIYILPLFSLISKLFSKDNSIFKTIKIIIKVLIVIHIVLGGFLILYFTDFVTPINNSYLLYYDLLEPYIELIKQLWTKLLNYFNTLPDSTSINKNELESVIKDSTSQIKTEVKEGIKDGVNEVLAELIDEMHNENKFELLKQLSFYSSLLFFGYFFFILPGPSISPETLTEYNWLNQGLIEVKITLKDYILWLFTDPGNPGNPGNVGGTTVIESPITPKAQLNNYLPIERGDSGTSAWSEPSSSTITPNSPRNNITLTPLTENISEGTQTVITNTLSKEIQTNIDGLNVRKMGVAMDIYSNALPEEVNNHVIENVNNIITKITD